MEKINILQVMPEFGLAGAEMMCETLVNQLVSTGEYNVFVVSLFDFHSPITDRMEKNGITLYYIGKKAGVDLSVIFKLNRIMDDLNIQIVHTHLYVMQYVIPAAIFARVPIRVHTVHNESTMELSFFRRKLASVFYKFCNVKPVSISPLITDTIVSEYGLKVESIPMIYNGIELTNCLVKTNYQVTDGIFRFLHVGRMSYQKNQQVIIDAAKYLVNEGRKFVIDLVGGGEDENNIKSAVLESGMSDYFHFYGLQDDVYQFLYRADCFILPSRYEGMPISLIEAMGCGVPIVASAVGGVPNMISNNVSGLLINPDAPSLYSAMVKMMDCDEHFREYLGRNAIEKSKLFSAQEMRDGYVNVYMESMNNLHTR